MLVSDPSHRPPILEEMMPDIRQVINVQAKTYTDHTCAALNFDDLVSEGNVKLAKIITAGWLDKLPNRSEFFKFFKAAVANHFKGLVHRHRFTQKRTGVKAPPRGEALSEDNWNSMECVKQVEIPIDRAVSDEGMQEQFEDTSVHGFDESFMADISPLLTPVEKVVLEQLTSPNQEALIYAQLDSARGAESGKSKRVRIRAVHYAKGVGMDLQTWNSVQDTLRLKVQKYMKSDDDVAYNSAVRILEEAFDLQIPKTIDTMVVRRMITLAARDHLQKLTPEVCDAVKAVGAKLPTTLASSLSCFGVLYSRGDGICNTCGLRVACATEASNYGLGEIALSPALLGTKNIRVPVLAPRASGGDPVFTNPRDEEVYSHLCEHFEKTPVKNEIFFRHRDFDGGASLHGMKGMVFCLDESSRFRFIKPSEKMSRELTKIGTGFYLPNDATVSDAVELIDAHARHTYAE